MCIRDRITTHDFVVTHRGRATAEELFSGARILEAIPSQAAHVGLEEQGELVTVFSRATLRERPAVTQRKSDLGALFRTFTQERTIGEIIEQEQRDAPNEHLERWVLETCRALYEADLITLRLPSKP